MLMHETPKCAYYYTDYQTFEQILLKGTLRFKESTSSNDLEDTNRLFKRAVQALGKEPIKEYSEESVVRDILQSGFKEQRVSLVACFTLKQDSRMLWDAYTMHRKDRENKKYNGVCLEIDIDELNMIIENQNSFDFKMTMPVRYGDKEADKAIEELICSYRKEIEELSKDADQTQDLIEPIRIPMFYKYLEIKLKKCIVYPILYFLDRFGKLSPFYKHSFWREEEEVRSVLSFKKVDIEKNEKIQKESKNDQEYYYFDLPINKKCISKVILGPEFSEEDKNNLNGDEFIIKLKELNIDLSEGTGVITNR